MQIKAAFLLLLSASPIDRVAAAGCTTKQISSMDVGSCTCAGQLTGCTTNCAVCSGAFTPTKKVKSCSGGCTDSEHDCQACGIWFHTLCNCLQHPTGSTPCPNSGSITKGGPPVWVLLKNSGQGHDLVTTTELLPGIEKMGPGHDQGWQFAQKESTPKSQAVFLNSVRARDMEQVHIHLCNSNQATAKMLSQEKIKSSTQLKQLDGDKNLYCLGVDHAVRITGFAGIIANFMANLPSTISKPCKELVGAGIIQDTTGRTWACASTNSGGPQDKFC
ncbi:uncharacterized protein F5Z01DRAFT_668153 [Emericellopsis atlantica]|uniref:Uncharacterized protein n=1 Tax=Emericellopsis atlantica TaxID=2614577 RepID=A0A9P7ZDN9_9HYPO|nr:uncharacterized protein F5Z01DRAFT_668153 [Emericellopsis atlantica]KAG9249816.1 hypothetical protein F5Z01DRAFT_668153 [Emericellopsis atlantica]